MDLKLYEVEKSSTESIKAPLNHLTLREQMIPSLSDVKYKYSYNA